MEKTVTKGFWMLIAVSAIAILASPSISAARTISSIQKIDSALSIRAGSGFVGTQGMVQAASLENLGVVPAVKGVTAPGYRIIEAQNILSVIDNTNALSQISSISNITDAKVIAAPIEGRSMIPEISGDGQINTIAAQIKAVPTTPIIMSPSSVGKQIQPKAIRADAIAGIKSNNIANIGSGSLYEINARICEGVLAYHNASIVAVSPGVNVINIGLIKGSVPAERGDANLIGVGIGNSNRYGNWIVNGVNSSGMQIIGNEFSPRA